MTDIKRVSMIEDVDVFNRNIAPSTIELEKWIKEVFGDNSTFIPNDTDILSVNPDFDDESELANVYQYCLGENYKAALIEFTKNDFADSLANNLLDVNDNNYDGFYQFSDSIKGIMWAASQINDDIYDDVVNIVKDTINNKDFLNAISNSIEVDVNSVATHYYFNGEIFDADGIKNTMFNFLETDTDFLQELESHLITNEVEEKLEQPEIKEQVQKWADSIGLDVEFDSDNIFDILKSLRNGVSMWVNDPDFEFASDIAEDLESGAYVFSDDIEPIFNAFEETTDSEDKYEILSDAVSSSLGAANINRICNTFINIDFTTDKPQLMIRETPIDFENFKYQFVSFLSDEPSINIFSKIANNIVTDEIQDILNHRPKSFTPK